MKTGGIFLVIFGLLALFIATTGRYVCFEQFIVGVFSGNCGCGGTSGNTGAAKPIAGASGFLPAGSGGLGGFGGGIIPFNFPFGDFPTKSPDFNPFPSNPFQIPGFSPFFN